MNVFEAALLEKFDEVIAVLGKKVPEGFECHICYAEATVQEDDCTWCTDCHKRIMIGETTVTYQQLRIEKGIIKKD